MTPSLGLLMAGVALLFASSLPTPFWAYFLILSLLSMIAANVINWVHNK